MQHKDIVTKLLAHYKDVYVRVENIKSVYDIHELLESTSTLYGICCCANEQLNEHIYEQDWVQKYGKLWADYPYLSGTKTEILGLLQIRIDNLKKELELINSKN